MQGWVRASRVLALVEFQGNAALFVLHSARIPPEATTDLCVEKAIPIDADFKCEIGKFLLSGGYLAVIAASKIPLPKLARYFLRDNAYFMVQGGKPRHNVHSTLSRQYVASVREGKPCLLASFPHQAREGKPFLLASFPHHAREGKPLCLLVGFPHHCENLSPSPRYRIVY